MVEAEDITQGTEAPGRDKSGDAALLREIRSKYKYYKEAWREQQEHREKLMRYLSGHPWTEDEERARDGRPSISHDELNQYVFQCVNSARQNKRGIKIEPEGNGANDKTALLRENIARTIEYRSQAQSIYLQCYQDCVEGSYGFFRVSRRYISDDSDDQEIYFSPIANPDSILYDPDCKLPDWSDARGVFELDPVSEEDFKREYPDAELTGFADEDGSIKQDWLQDKKVLKAAYWKIVTKRVKGATGRWVDKKTVVQYVTNGVEILEENPQPGKEIPIVPMVGLQRFEKDGSTVKRKIYALASFALDAQKSLAYFESLEAEQAGLTPKIPWVGYVGQFETDSDAWENSTKVPRAMLQVDVVVDGAGGALPLPQRQSFTFQSLEVEKESARRAIQAAMATSPLPTQAQRQNEKSGVALSKISAAASLGSYHFVSSLEMGITRAGRIVDSWISVTYDTKREMHLRQADEKRIPVTLNADQADEDGEKNTIGDESHDVTIGVAPSNDSEREAASDFLDLLITNLEKIPPPGSPQAKLLAMAIKMKQLGPMGDAMAEIISPEEQGKPVPPEAQQAIQQRDQQLKALHAYSQDLEGQVGKLTFEKQAKVVELDKKHQNDMELERLKQAGDFARDEITTKAQIMSERVAAIENLVAQFHDQAHDTAMAAQGNAHTQANADQTQQHTQDNAQQQADLQPEPEPVGATA